MEGWRAGLGLPVNPPRPPKLYSIGFMECIFLCPDACFDVFKVALLGVKLGLGVASALLRPSALGAFWGLPGG